MASPSWELPCSASPSLSFAGVGCGLAFYCCFCLRAICVLRPRSCLSAVGVWRLRQHSVCHVSMQALFRPHLAATRLLGSDGHLSPVLAGRACRSCSEGVVAPLRRLGQGCVAGGRPRKTRAFIPRLPSPLRWWSSALPEPVSCSRVFAVSRMGVGAKQLCSSQSLDEVGNQSPPGGRVRLRIDVVRHLGSPPRAAHLCSPSSRPFLPAPRHAMTPASCRGPRRCVGDLAGLRRGLLVALPALPTAGAGGTAA